MPAFKKSRRCMPVALPFDRPTMRAVICLSSTCPANESFGRGLQLVCPNRSLQRIVFCAERDLAEVHVVRRVEQTAPNPTMPHEDFDDFGFGVQKPRDRAVA